MPSTAIGSDTDAGSSALPQATSIRAAMSKNKMERFVYFFMMGSLYFYIFLLTRIFLAIKFGVCVYTWFFNDGRFHLVPDLPLRSEK